MTLEQDLDLDHITQTVEREYQERFIAQTHAYRWILNQFPPEYKILKSVWEDCSYPSAIQAWGVTDSAEELFLLPEHLDQVWLNRTHIDHPNQWLVFTVTVGDLSLRTKESLNDEIEEEGSPDYLESVLIEMEYSLERGTSELGKALSVALSTGQLRYFHIHFNDLETIQISEPSVYEFPIYPALSVDQDLDWR
jgi:hypothetical protein